MKPRARGRQIFIGAVGALLIAAGSAQAATVFFKGKVIGDPNSVMSFEVRGPLEADRTIKWGRAHIEEIVVAGVDTTITCVGKEPSKTESTFFFEKDIDIQPDGDFRGEEKTNPGFPVDGGKQVIKGQFRDGEQASLGSLRMHYVELDPDHGDCVWDTGKVHWKARGVDS